MFSTWRTWILWLGMSCLSAAAVAQDSTYQLRVMHYNLLNFGINIGDCVFDVQRYQELETILTHYRPHIFTVNEIGLSTLYPTGILNECFTYTQAMARTISTNQAGGDRTNHLFYDQTLFGLKSESVLPSGSIRDISLYELYFKPSIALGDTVFLSCLVAHLKAGDGSVNVNARNAAAQDIMSWVQTQGQGKNLLLLGDLNLSNSSEATFQTLIAPSDATLAWRDPINVTSGWNGQAFAGVHTQSTRSSGNACFSGGGMDDRFDFILTSRQVLDGSEGLQYVDGSYRAFGNAGNGFDQGLSCGSANPSVPNAVCLALRNMSDHLPVVMEVAIQGQRTTDLQVMAQSLQVVPSPFDQQLTLTFSAGVPRGEGWEVTLMDATGRTVGTQAWPSGQTRLIMATDAWPTGLYLLRLSQGNRPLLQRKLLKVVH
jgi:hypothetical protein